MFCLLYYNIVAGPMFMNTSIHIYIISNLHNLVVATTMSNEGARNGRKSQNKRMIGNSLSSIHLSNTNIYICYILFTSLRSSMIRSLMIIILKIAYQSVS